MDRITVLLRSKTFYGALLAAAAWLLNQPHIGLPEVAQALGGVLSAAGVRDAITKLGASSPVPPTPPTQAAP